jgi:FimV-like protein
VKKWIGLILIIIGTQVVAADGNEPRVVYVEESKSLWSVALSVKPTGVKVWQALIALYESNPAAFYQNDVNKLKDNVTLVVPSTEVMLSLTEAEALVRFQLLGDQPQQSLNNVTLDTPSKPSVDPITDPIVETTIDESVTALNLPVLDNTKESTDDKAQNVLTLNEEDAILVVKPCPSFTCNPKRKTYVDAHGFSNVGEFYVSIGANRLNDYSITRSEFELYEPMLYQLDGKNGLDVNFGYLWSDGIVLELGYQQNNSDFYSLETGDSGQLYLPNGFRPTRKTQLISPKIIFIEDIGKNISIYSGLGVGLYKDTYPSALFAQDLTANKTVYGGLYQIILGSKLQLTDEFFIDLRVQNKHYLPKDFPFTMHYANGSRPEELLTLYRHDTLDVTLSIGMKFRELTIVWE